MRGDLIETFKIIKGIFNYSLHFFNVSPRNTSLLSRQFSPTKSTHRLDPFAYRVKYFKNKLSNQIKNSNSVQNLKIKLDDFRKNVKKQNLEGILGIIGRITQQNLIFILMMY